MFDRVFVSDPSFKSSCAQKQSCRFSSPLQLLFWPKFMFQCKIWSFGRSKSAKNHSKLVVVLPCCACARRSRRRSRRASHRQAHRRLSSSLSPHWASPSLLLSFPFLAPSGARSGAEPSRAHRRRPPAVLCRRSSPQAAESRFTPPHTSATTSRARFRRSPAGIEPVTTGRH